MRALRATAALVTVWCLGCSAFEPLLARLIGSAAGPGMVCASDDGMGELVSAAPGGAARAALDGAPELTAMSAENAPSPRGIDCGCQSCNAASPTVLTAAVDLLPTPSIPEATPTPPLSVEREPLVPPPQSVL